MKIRAVIASLVVLIIAVAVLAVGYISTKNRSMEYSYALEDYYQRTYYELVNNISDIELNLSKGIVASGNQTKTKAFENVQKDCFSATNNLSRLPVNHESINETTRLVNQLGGYSYYLLQKFSSGSSLSENDLSQLDTLYDYTIRVQQMLNDFSKSINDDFSFVDQMMENKDNQMNTNFSGIQSKVTGVEYPTLIYDGPFSDSVMNKEVKGLTGEEVTKDDAKKIIWEKVGAKYTIDNVEYTGETQSKINTYDYKITLKDLPDMYAQVTKKGGLVITLSSVAGTGEEKLSLDESKNKAEEFAKILDYTGVKAVWGTIINNTAYINLTTVIENTIIYPEMIKVKVDIQNGNIIGFEATNYIYNHVQREIPFTGISAADAQKTIDKRLKIDTQKLCVIPKEYGSDVFCYEFKCTLNSYTYYVYVNAVNGQEENILRVVNTNDGELLQ